MERGVWDKWQCEVDASDDIQPMDENLKAHKLFKRGKITNLTNSYFMINHSRSKAFG